MDAERNKDGATRRAQALANETRDDLPSTHARGWRLSSVSRCRCDTARFPAALRHPRDLRAASQPRPASFSVFALLSIAPRSPP